jgi:hypothetical protein
MLLDRSITPLATNPSAATAGCHFFGELTDRFGAQGRTRQGAS